MKPFALFALTLMLATAAFAQKKGGGAAGPDTQNTPPPTRVPVGPGPKSKAELEAVQKRLRRARSRMPPLRRLTRW